LRDGVEGAGSRQGRGRGRGRERGPQAVCVTYASDGNLDEHKVYFYTVFANDVQGVWQLAAHASGKPHDRLSWWHRSAEELAGTERDEPGLDGFHLPHHNR
jgi:hypothetical protein